jgi:hypothetical protein
MVPNCRGSNHAVGERPERLPVVLKRRPASSDSSRVIGITPVKTSATRVHSSSLKGPHRNSAQVMALTKIGTSCPIQSKTVFVNSGAVLAANRIR